MVDIFNPICYCNADGEVLTTLKVSIDQVHVMSLTFCDIYKSLYLIQTQGRRSRGGWGGLLPPPNIEVGGLSPPLRYHQVMNNCERVFFEIAVLPVPEFK